MTFPNLKNLKLLLRLELRNCLITGPIPNYIGEIESLKSMFNPRFISGFRKSKLLVSD
ncbi:hypothetical protein AAZX31_17G175700 [Glycine max]